MSPLVIPSSASMMIHTSRPLSDKSKQDAATVERLLQKHFPLHNFRVLPSIKDECINLCYLFEGATEYTEVNTRKFLTFLQENKIGVVVDTLHRKHLKRKGGRQ